MMKLRLVFKNKLGTIVHREANEKMQKQISFGNLHDFKNLPCKKLNHILNGKKKITIDPLFAIISQR